MQFLRRKEGGESASEFTLNGLRLGGSLEEAREVLGDCIVSESLLPGPVDYRFKNGVIVTLDSDGTIVAIRGDLLYLDGRPVLKASDPPKLFEKVLGPAAAELLHVSEYQVGHHSIVRSYKDDDLQLRLDIHSWSALF